MDKKIHIIDKTDFNNYKNLIFSEIELDGFTDEYNLSYYCILDTLREIHYRGSIILKEIFSLTLTFENELIKQIDIFNKEEQLIGTIIGDTYLDIFIINNYSIEIE